MICTPTEIAILLIGGGIVALLSWRTYKRLFLRPYQPCEHGARHPGVCRECPRG